MAECSAQPGGDQTRIWAHFQKNAPESFDAANPRLEFLVKEIARHSPQQRSVVLNVGVGNGHFERQAVQRGWEVHSLDPVAAALAPLESLKVHAHVGLIERMPLVDESCDYVVASEVLEHLTEEQGKLALAEVVRVLRPGGLFLGTVPYHENLAASQVICPHCGELFHRWGHHRSFDEASLHSELSSHFTVKTLRCTAFPGFRGRSFAGKTKSLIRIALARCRQMIAIPSLYWCAVRTQARHAQRYL